MVFQDPMTSLNPVLKVGSQIAEAITTHQPDDEGRRRSRAQRSSCSGSSASRIPSSGYEQYPHEFSGGMRQRAMIAMAIANSPSLLIADEPTTALDVTIQAQILEVLKKAQDETHAATILITHDLGLDRRARRPRRRHVRAAASSSSATCTRSSRRRGTRTRSG